MTSRMTTRQINDNWAPNLLTKDWSYVGQPDLISPPPDGHRRLEDKVRLLDMRQCVAGMVLSGALDMVLHKLVQEGDTVTRNTPTETNKHNPLAACNPFGIF